MYVLKQSTAVTIPIFAHDANGDGVAGLLTGDWSAKRIRKEGGSWGAMTATIIPSKTENFQVHIFQEPISVQKCLQRERELKGI